MAPFPAFENDNHEQKPLVLGDLHFEAGADRHRERRKTKWERTVAESKIIFNKVIAGRYKSDETGYDEVGVLLITWEKDDTLSRRREVPRLRDVFETKFGYTVDEYQIPSEQSATGLALALAKFAHRYDGPNKMAIVYYGGHGDLINNRMGLFAKEAGDGDGDPQAFLDDAMNQLKLPDTDILTIIDCCYAARAFNRDDMGKRKFELLAATPASERARAPEHEKSFTKNLCDTIEKLLETHPKGFTTSKLYQQVYFKQEDARKPLLFDQSAYDYGKIWLKPFRREPKPSEKTGEPVAYIELKLKLPEVPSQLRMNELAKAMQYLPHVEEVEFKQMNAPRHELDQFMNGVHKVMKLRPLIAKLPSRRLAKKRREAGIPEEPKEAEQLSKTSLHTERKRSSVYDWSDSTLQEAGKAHTPVSARPRTDSPLSMHAEESEADAHTHTHEDALEGAKVHHVGSSFSYVYTLDFSGLKERLAPIQSRISQSVHMMDGDMLLMLFFIGVLLACFSTSLWNIFFD